MFCNTSIALARHTEERLWIPLGHQQKLGQDNDTFDCGIRTWNEKGIWMLKTEEPLTWSIGQAFQDLPIFYFKFLTFFSILSRINLAKVIQGNWPYKPWFATHPDTSLEFPWNIFDAIVAAPFLSRKKARQNKQKPVAKGGTEKEFLVGKERGEDKACSCHNFSLGGGNVEKVNVSLHFKQEPCSISDPGTTIE